ncbi:hypothetical protein [Streptosporangium sp. NPDC000396]|uniref:hypothetical protein n=1 Tax=Streptosporangium sp. NPDC000396 TaxID=3366185 RepID=UPI0036C72A89
MSQYAAIVDQGASSSRRTAFGHDDRITSTVRCERRRVLPRPGRAEHDAPEIWTARHVPRLLPWAEPGVSTLKEFR